MIQYYGLPEKQKMQKKEGRSSSNLFVASAGVCTLVVCLCSVSGESVRENLML